MPCCRDRCFIAGALAALLVLPVAVPGFSKGMLAEGTRPSWGRLATNIDPMIALGNDLRNRSSGTVLRYFTDSRTAHLPAHLGDRGPHRRPLGAGP